MVSLSTALRLKACTEPHLEGSHYDDAIVSSQRLTHLTRDIISKMNINSERNSLQFGEGFVVLPEPLDGDEVSIEQFALQWAFSTISLSRGALADESHRITSMDHGGLRSTKGSQRGVRNFEVALCDQLAMPNVEACNRNADCRDGEKNDQHRRELHNRSQGGYGYL